MIDKQKIKLFKELFNRCESVVIIYSNISTRDNLLAAATLYWGVKKGTKKNVKLIAPTDLSKQEDDIFFLEETRIDIGHENLCISLDYIEDSIDKVSYHTNEQTKKFYLTIRPKKGFPPLSSKNVNFSYTGARADMIILVGVNDLPSLGNLYSNYESLFNDATLVSINSGKNNLSNLEFDVSKYSSFSEFVAELLLDLEIPLDPKMATNLLVGINEETDGYITNNATANTFDIIASLMRAGAKRFIDDLSISDKKDKSKNTKQEKEVFKLKKKSSKS